MTSGRTKLALALGAAAAGLAAWREIQSRAAERANPPKGRFVRVRGVRLHVLERGPRDAPPVVVLHGNGATVEDISSSGLLDALAADHRVVVLDRPGFGHTSRPRLRLWDAKAQAALVADAMAVLGLDRPIVVGHSWGALVGAALGVTRPEAVGALALLSGFYYPTPRGDVALFSLPAVPVLGDLFRYTAGPSLTAAAEPYITQRIYEPQPVPARFRQAYPHALATRPSQIRAASEDTMFMLPSAAGLADRYGEIRVPTLIMAGDADRIVATHEQSVPLHHAIPGSRLEILPGLGHMIHHFAAPDIARAVRRLAERDEPSDEAPVMDVRGPVTASSLHVHGARDA
jgi:pimeloyl-ACP methyl ester carboxylesterase